MLKHRLQKFRSNLFSTYEAHRLRDKPFVIISNNCWGYELYHSTGREYNTPFIGLFLYPECYIKLLKNFDSLIYSELRFASKSKYFDQEKNYPIGILGDTIEIHFLHYSSTEEAQNKWNRRLERMQQAINNNVPLYVKLCDSEACTPGHLTEFHSLAFPNKISIGLQEFPSIHHFHVPSLIEKKKKALIDGAKLFNKRYKYFDITEWILTARMTNTSLGKIFSFLS
jgi:uncharacterized protein (DUF1919 family)